MRLPCAPCTPAPCPVMVHCRRTRPCNVAPRAWRSASGGPQGQETRIWTPPRCPLETVIYGLLHVVHLKRSVLPGGNRQRRERRGTGGGRCRSVPGRKRASGHNCPSTVAGGGSPAGPQRSGGAALARLDAPPATVALTPPRPLQGALVGVPRRRRVASNRLQSYIRPLCGDASLRATMEVAHRGPHVVSASGAGVSIGLVRCRSVRGAMSFVHSLSSCGGRLIHAAKATSRVQTAHTIRASLLATASVALL